MERPTDPTFKTKANERLVRLMDEEFTLPGTKFRFGLDPILGLVPVLGGIATYIVSGGIALTMLRHGTSGKLAAKMIGNIVLDALIGSIPLLGRLFRTKGESAQKRNLLIFVTANLVSPGGSPKKQPLPNAPAGTLFQNPVVVTPAGVEMRGGSKAR